MSDSQRPIPHETEAAQLLRRRKMVAIASTAVVAAVLIALGIVLCRPVMALVRNRESFRAWLDGRGALKYAIMAGLMMLQIIIAIIPGGPMEIAAGYAFGPFLGTLLCVLGSVLGTWIIFLLTRRFGMKLVRLFVTDRQMSSMKLLNDRRRLHLVLFLLFLVPGTPKDIITYFGGVLPITMSSFLLITSIARTPAIFVSTLGGHWIGKQYYGPALFVLAVTLVVTLAASWWYQRRTRPDVPAIDPEEKADV